jgi:hypothetical protein
MSLDFLEEDYENNFTKYQSSNFEAGNSSLSSDELVDKETESDEQPTGGNLYKPEKNDKKKKISNKIVNTIKKNKAVAYSGGGLGAVTFIIIILVFLGAQELPGFAALIAATNMAKDNQLLERDTTELDAQKAALDEETPEEQATLDSTYSDSSTDGLLTKIDDYNPDQVMDNLTAGSDIDFNYSGNVLKSVEINGQPPVLEKSVPVSDWANTDDATEALTSDTSSIAELMTNIGGLDESGGILIRSGVAPTEIDAVEGDALDGVDNSQFENQNAENSEVILDEDAQSSIDPTASTPPVSTTDALKSAEEQAVSQEDADATNPTAIKQIIADGGTDNAVEAAMNSGSGLDSLTGISSDLAGLSPAYALAVPACIIFDGSLVSTNAQTTVDNQNEETERTFVFVQSTADQEKSGDLSAQAAGAINQKLSGLDQSNPEVAARGGQVNTLSGVVSPQSGTGATYSVVNLFGGASSSLINYVLKKACPVLTDKTVALGLLAGQLIATIISLGSIDAVEVAADGAIDVAVDGVVEGTVDSTTDAITSSATNGVITKSAVEYIQENGLGDYLKALSEKASNYITGQGGVGQVLVQGQKAVIVQGSKLAVVAGATYGIMLLAHEAVEQDIGSTYDGYSQGTDFANQADEGGNALSNEIMQKQYYGAPLSADQVTYNKSKNLAYLSTQNSSKSAYQRYFALSNPYSLLSKVSTRTYADVTNFSIRSLFEKVANIFSPSKLVSSLFSLFKGSKIYAVSSTPTPDPTDYGIVQWGYTSQEDALANPVSGNPSYQPLQNAKILNEQPLINGQTVSQYIQQTYGPCFSDSIGTLLTTKPSTGPDTSENYIVRDSTGDVVAGLCSEAYLGPDSIDTNAQDHTKNSSGSEIYGRDLIFRWRLDQSYNQSLDLLNNIQDANS